MTENKKRICTFRFRDHRLKFYQQISAFQQTRMSFKLFSGSLFCKYHKLLTLSSFGIYLFSLYTGCSSVQLLSHVQLFATAWHAVCQASLSITKSWSLPKLMSIELVMPSNHLILCCPLILLLSIFPSIKVFSNESALCMRWPKYRSFSFNINPSNEHPGQMSFRMDWLGARCREELPRLGSQGRQTRGATPRSRKPPYQLIFLQKLPPLLDSCPTRHESLHPPTTGKDASLLCPVRTLSALCRAQRPRQEPRGQMHFPMGLSQGRWF